MRFISTFLLISILFLAGCNHETVKNNYFLSLMGESESWKLMNYEIKITPEIFMAGNGTLHMKGTDEYKTDSFWIEVHAVINGDDKVINKNGVTGPGIDIAQEITGAVEGGTYIDKDGNSITLNDISNIYMILEWWDIEQEKNVKERIELYQPTESDVQ